MSSNYLAHLHQVLTIKRPQHKTSSVQNVLTTKRPGTRRSHKFSQTHNVLCKKNYSSASYQEFHQQEQMASAGPNYQSDEKLTFFRRRYDMNERSQMQGGKYRIFPKEMNENRFFLDSHWLEIWKNHFRPTMGPNGGSVAMDSGCLVLRW